MKLMELAPAEVLRLALPSEVRASLPEAVQPYLEQDVQFGDDDEPWRQWLDSKIGKVLFSERLSLDGVISLWHPNLW